MKTNEYGLVPGVALKNFEVYKAGQLCGFEPAIAQRLIDRGYWKPNDAENVEAGETATRGRARKDDTPKQKLLVGVESGTVEIPLNWRDDTAKNRLTWAKQINAEANKDTVDEIIGAAVKDQEEALQRAST